MAKIDLKPRTETVTLVLDPDTRAEYDRLITERTTASIPGRRMSEKKPDLADLDKRIEDAKTRVGDAAVTFTLSALPADDYRTILEAHPPRKGDDADSRVGFNRKTFRTALAGECITSVVDGAGEPVEWDAPDDWDYLAPQLSDAQADEFYQAALTVNRQGVQVPT